MLALLLVAFLAPLEGSCQVFGGVNIRFPRDGLSTACLAALDTKVSCPSQLGFTTNMDGIVDVLPAEGLEIVCKTQCHADLQAVRDKVAKACTVSTDKMEYDGVSYPAMLIADRYLYTLDVACHKDRTTGQFCDLMLADWRNQSKEADKCSDCILGPMKIGLESPLEYNSEDAADFASLTKECRATGYEYKTPTPYATATSSSTGDDDSEGTGTPTPAACDGREYVVKQNDTCQSIALAQKVSTYALVQGNGIDIYCTGLPAPGRKLCLPEEECIPYILNPGDTCDGLAEAANTTAEQIRRWNPIFNFHCTNADGWYGYVVCVSGNDTSTGTGTPSQTDSASAPTFTWNPPVNKPRAPGTLEEGCTRYLDAVDNGGDRNTCWFVSSFQDVGYDDFLRWNPSLKEDDCNLEPKYSYCVEGPASRVN